MALPQLYIIDSSHLCPTGGCKTLIYPTSALKNQFNPENTTSMPAIKLIFCLELLEIFIP